LYGEEPVTPEEIKLRSARTNTEAIYSPTEAESKDQLEPQCIKAVENLQSYQEETRAWRDKKSKTKAHRSRGPGIAMEPPHRNNKEVGT
jgi:hypothetical protein